MALRLKRTDHIADLELKLSRGYLDERTAQDLCAAAEDLRLDDEVAVVVLRTQGKDFCLGFVGEPWGAELDCVGAVASLPQPVLAAVQGRAWAEGCELAMACDLRLAAAAASFRLPQVGERRLPSRGGTQRLPRLVGAARALEILWSGRAVRAAEAERIGLASRAVPSAGLGRAVDEIAGELAAKGPIALRLAKEAVRAAADLTLEQGIRLEQDLYVLLQTTADRAEGVQAFLQKRKPRFENR